MHLSVYEYIFSSMYVACSVPVSLSKFLYMNLHIIYLLLLLTQIKITGCVSSPRNYRMILALITFV